MNSTATFLGPVNQLPAEGSEPVLDTRSEFGYCASLFRDSQLTFSVSPDGVMLGSNPQDKEVFQQLAIHFGENQEESPEPSLAWEEHAYAIQLQGLFRNREAFSTLSDASEPEDCVRRFLEVLSSSLDQCGIEHAGAKLPVIRWQPGEDGHSARVQLLGILLADDRHFDEIRQSAHGDVGLIYEDAEVSARGLREAVTVLTLLGIVLGSTTQAEAGLFKNLRAKKEARMQQTMQQQIAQRTPPPVRQPSSTGWQDVHNDASIDFALLEAGKDSPKKVIVDVSAQRAYLLVDGQVAINMAISTARSGKETPRGEFTITERVATGKVSTIYGCDLPYWQRLDQTAIGLHVGDLPGYPASAGCIRLPHSVAPVFFQNTSRGLTVSVVDNWSQKELQQGSARPDILVARVIGENTDS